MIRNGEYEQHNGKNSSHEGLQEGRESIKIFLQIFILNFFILTNGDGFVWRVKNVDILLMGSYNRHFSLSLLLLHLLLLDLLNLLLLNLLLLNLLLNLLLKS